MSPSAPFHIFSMNRLNDFVGKPPKNKITTVILFFNLKNNKIQHKQTKHKHKKTMQTTNAFGCLTAKQEIGSHNDHSVLTSLQFKIHWKFNRIKRKTIFLLKYIIIIKFIHLDQLTQRWTNVRIVVCRRQARDFARRHCSARCNREYQSRLDKTHNVVIDHSQIW